MTTTNIFDDIQDRYPHSRSLDYALNPEKYVEQEKAYRVELIKEFYEEKTDSESSEESSSLSGRVKKVDDSYEGSQLLEVILLIIIIIAMVIILPLLL